MTRYWTQKREREREREDRKSLEVKEIEEGKIRLYLEKST